MTHGLFRDTLPLARRIVFDAALAENPLDLRRAIALLKERIDLLVKAEPGRLDILVPALGRLTRMVATHYHLSQSDSDRLTEATRNVLEEIERTLGGPEE